MLTFWEANSVSSSSSNPCSTLKDVLADLDITPLTPEWVAEHKQIKLLETLYQLRPREAAEIEEREFGSWEYAELHRLQEETKRQLSGDPPLIRFWQMPEGIRLYTYLRWVTGPLVEAANVPEFILAKASEIASSLPEAIFAVEQLRSERRVYDPFLVVSYGDERYYVDVWDEAAFASEHT